MNNAPLVYIATQPENDGLTMPTLLSLLAHGIVFGLLIYTYQQPSLETTSAIETTMISPEQLAELQGQILSNRAAAAAAASSADSSLSAESLDSPASDSSPDSTQPSSQRVPVFIRSDETADDSIIVSQDQQQRLAEQSAAYERNLAEWNTQSDASANERLEQVEQRKQEDSDEERERLKEYRNKQNNTTTPRIKRPSNTDRNIEIETGVSNNTGKNFSLSDGQSTASSSSKNNDSGSSASASDFKKGIADKIQRNLKAPIETQGMTARVTIKLDVRGNVVSAKANGSNDAVNKAAEKAALAASPLPIDLNNPASFSHLTINIVVQ